jgi:two-component system, NtrC family, sensor kinase
MTDLPGFSDSRTGWLAGLRTGRVSLRAKITAAFTVVVIGGTAVSTLIGSWIITSALLDEARARNAHGLDAARTIYTETLDTAARLVGRAASAQALVDAAHVGSTEAFSPIVRKLRDESGLDFLEFVPSRQIEQGVGPCLTEPSLRRLVESARGGARANGTEVLQRPCLLAQSATLADRADTRVVATGERGDRPAETTAGLALVAAAPVGGAESPQAGVLYGGMLLNGRSDLVDRVKQLVYGNVSYRGRKTGTVSIFFDDVRVATTATAEPEQAIGTLLPAQVPRSVLTSGERWQGRALEGHDWYVAAYEPLRNYSGQVVGAVYVGLLEAPILAIRTDVMLTFLLVCVVGLGVVFAFTYLITRRTISPLEEMVAATKRIAGGDLSVRVSVSSRDEIGDLAASFNNMLSSLQTTKSELEEWGRKLEERVRQRTEELVTVQSRMAQSEKLASIGRLAAGVAHSINNPLGGILSLSMLALESPDPTPALRADLKTIAEQAMRCREIVKGLLDFSRESEGRRAKTEITPIVDATVSLLERQGVFHSIEVVRRLETGLPPVLIDPGRLQEVLSSLVLNAVDAMEERGVLTVETTAAPGSAEVLIRVQDTGRGIAPDVMPFIFEPFFTTKKVGKGTGLGLAIVHGIVTGAGGRVEVATSPQGTTFTIRLPIAPGPQGESRRGGNSGNWETG